MERLTMRSIRQNSQAGMSMLEVMVATVILMVSSLGVIGLVWTAILMNNRNKVDSTQTMLAESVIEQVNSTIIGSGSSALTDCDETTWTINTEKGGAALNGAGINFTQTSPPADYVMTYVLRAPCRPDGDLVATYDVRWNVQIVGEAEGMSTNTFLVTVGSRRAGSGTNALVDSPPIAMRVMVGN
jgi:Tfp pilus assembly protein PilV